MTGESAEVEKSTQGDPLDKETLLSNRKNMVFLGTYITAGSAKVLIVKTGQETQLGNISKNLKEINVGEIPLRAKVNEIAKYLGLAVILFMFVSVIVNLINLHSHGDLFIDGALNLHLFARVAVKSLTMAISVIPINIPLLTTIILVTGVLAMAKQGVIVRDLNAVERLGRVSIVCSDKTGTITRNEMTVKWMVLPTLSTNISASK